ncbi:hypothetical protein, partial [Ferrovibrio sp.]|uniref:hypothetical protein n=1 Tax=Ferrovibrio sp. TaxID=1917215 RepID=UPI00311D7DED
MNQCCAVPAFRPERVMDQRFIDRIRMRGGRPQEGSNAKGQLTASLLQQRFSLTGAKFIRL